jgi:hypothetical protein
MVEDTTAESQQDKFGNQQQYTDGTYQPDLTGTELVDYNDPANRYPEFTPEPIDKRPLIIGIVIASAILLISIIVGVWLYLHPDVADVVRDIVIIYLGISAFFILIALVILIVMIGYLTLKTNDLVKLLDREVRPLLYNIQETTNTVRGTTTFLSDKAVQPVIATVSSIAAVKAIFRSLFRR